MREIKFRAWDHQNNRWATNNDVAGSIGLVFGIKDYFINIAGERAVRFSFQQFTGLKDKNVVDIYEGDIVKAASAEIDINFITTDKFYDEDIQSVYWDAEGAGWFLTENRYKQVQPMAHRERFEVIGNIYQNPDLLK